MAKHTKPDIAQALNALAAEDLYTSATRFFNTLGYSSNRSVPPQGDTTAAAFIKQFPPLNTTVTATQSQQKMQRQVRSIQLLFQITDQDIKAEQDSP
ncbi:MAG: hypothetical protein ACR2PW_06790, partial [Gammaproteobacteria bacterium]